MNRIEIIQTFIDKLSAKNYLEIGVQAGHCFRAIRCENKTGVDPDPSSAATHKVTSDDFFKQNETCKGKWDIIFIDGLHHAEQVYIDIQNSLACLSKGGVIIMHDCLPTNKHMQEIPLTNQNEWTGDTWKAFVKLRQEREDLYMAVVDTDWGCGLIMEGQQNKLTTDLETNYENFANNKQEWMNIISVNKFRQMAML